MRSNAFFSSRIRAYSQALAVMVALYGTGACNKSANINANKASIAFTHLGYATGPVKLFVGNRTAPLFDSSISFGQTTGNFQSIYDTLTAGISDLQIRTAAEDSVIFGGFSAFQEGGKYNIFLIDSFTTSTRSLLILQNNATVRVDTFTNARFVNASIDSPRGILLVDVFDNPSAAYDTVIFGIQDFVRSDPDPSAHAFQMVRIGSYRMYAIRDSLPTNRSDSSTLRYLGYLRLDSSTNYNLILQGIGNAPPGIDQLQLKSVRVN